MCVRVLLSAAGAHKIAVIKVKEDRFDDDVFASFQTAIVHVGTYGIWCEAQDRITHVRVN